MCQQNNVRYGPIVGRLHTILQRAGEPVLVDHIGQPFTGTRAAETALHKTIRADAAQHADDLPNLTWKGYLVLREDNAHQRAWCEQYGHPVEWRVGEEIVVCRGRFDADTGRPQVATVVAERYVCYLSHHYPCWTTDHGPENWPRAVLDWSKGKTHWAHSLRLNWIDLRTGESLCRQVDVTTPVF